VTGDDPFRQGRRAAEFLVLNEVLLGLVTVVVTRDNVGLAEAKRHLSGEGKSCRFTASNAIFYN
jgi:hypothetical protein